MADYRDTVPLELPLAELERTIIDAYLRGAGEEPAAVRARDDAAAHRLLAQAAEYASGKLSEVESRMHYLRSLRGQE